MALTDKNIDRILAVVASKESVERLEQKMDTFEDTQKKILTGVDKLATAVEKQNMDNASRDMQLARHDGWIHKIAKETKTNLDG